MTSQACCFSGLSAAQHCLGGNFSQTSSGYCGQVATAAAAQQCWQSLGSNATGSMQCTPVKTAASNRGFASKPWSRLMALILMLSWTVMIAAAPQPAVKRDVSLGVYKGADNFMYYNDGVRVNWTELGPAHAQGYADILEGVSLADGVESTSNGKLKKRWTLLTYKREGDGNPHQNYKFTQRTPTFTCATGACSVSYQYSVTTTWSANVGGAWFASLGFSVSESRSDGASFSCGSSNSGRTCVWYQTDLTAYTAREYQSHCPNNGSPCGPAVYSRNLIMYSPNNRQCGLTWHCREGNDCAYENAEYYIKCGPAGAEGCDWRSPYPDGWGGWQYWQLPGGC
ncbi:uncharacterized protein UTRI_05393_B [Ustilago trichophora]|uniref:Uncharacterized protein n=1 Tax=Ustilago trichophora TaxID=86804 RepID=A0A5C3ENA0_9BASI|nr:uncharacterized protein UTRI_05393_B [Ustilago trichophora]